MGIADLPYQHAAGDGGPRSQTQMVVIHATDSTASDEAEASYATWRPDHTSAHVYNDEDSAIRGLPLDHIAYGCFPTGNSRSVQFELAGKSNQITDATMRRIAPYVAEVCGMYGLPIRHVGPAELRAGARGICGHGDVTRAWGEGDHTDPGDSFPWDTFIGYVQAAANPQPAPATQSSQEDDTMPAGIPPRDIPLVAHDTPTIWPVNSGAAGHGEAWINFANDTNGGTYTVRVWGTKGDGGYFAIGTAKDGIYTLGNGARLSLALPTGTAGLHVSRQKNPDGSKFAGPLTYCVEYGFPVRR